MKLYKKILLIAALTISLTACTKSVKEVPYTDVSFGTTVDQLTDRMDGKANTIEDENGVKKHIYEKSTYLDYTGKMIYYMVDDSSVFTRWEYTAKDSTEGKEIYQKICEQMTKDYGEGSQSDTGTSTVYNTQDNVAKTVLFTDDANGCIVSITSAQAQNSVQENVTTKQPASTEKSNNSEKDNGTKKDNSTEKKDNTKEKNSNTKKTQ